MKKETAPFADVLIVCGQGTCDNGRFYTEYADRDVYLGHALDVAMVVARFKYSHVVCSGGFTQHETPGISEAGSFLSMWEDYDAWPLERHCIFLDELALDSAENLYLGLMAAREGLGSTWIRRVGVCAAWKFKKPRFSRFAEALGILDCFYFHGFAAASEANAGPLSSGGEAAELHETSDAHDWLLLNDKWEGKRRKRYQGELPYAARLDHVRVMFPGVFEALDWVRKCGFQGNGVTQLRQAIRDEIIMPNPTGHQ